MRHCAPSRITGSVCSVQYNASLDGLKINTPSSAGTVVYDQSGMAPEKLIPELVQSLYETNLRDTFSFRGICSLPVF